MMDCLIKLYVTLSYMSNIPKSGIVLFIKFLLVVILWEAVQK